MPVTHYPCVISIMQYIEANKRIHLSLRCPSLRRIENSLPLHIDKLGINSNQLRINKIAYWHDGLTSEEALEVIFRNRKFPIYAYEIRKFPNGRTLINSKICPTSICLFYDHQNDLILDEDSMVLCIKHLKNLSIFADSFVEELFKHPVINQLDYLCLMADYHQVVPHLEQFSNLPIPNLGILTYSYPFDDIFVLKYWIEKKSRHHKFTLEENFVSKVDSIIPTLSETVDLKEGILEDQKCWIVHNEDPDEDCEVVLRSEKIKCSYFGIKFAISVQYLPRGSANINEN